MLFQTDHSKLYTFQKWWLDIDRRLTDLSVGWYNQLFGDLLVLLFKTADKLKLNKDLMGETPTSNLL